MSRRFLVLRLDAPLMSFGGVAVDAHGVTEDHPTLSMLTGLLANALGYTHGDFEALSRLQDRVVFGTRRDVGGRSRRGEPRVDPRSGPLVDYQTVDLGLPHLRSGGWTTRGAAEGRRGGAASKQTSIRHRHYLVDHVYLVLLTLDPPDEEPTLDDVSSALHRPARPLFIGRRSCIPSGPVLVVEVDADDLLSALSSLPRSRDPLDQDPTTVATVPLSLWLPVEVVPEDVAPTMPAVDGLWLHVADRRYWFNQVHTGRRWVRRLTVEVPDVG